MEKEREETGTPYTGDGSTTKVKSKSNLPKIVWGIIIVVIVIIAGGVIFF